MIARGVGVWYNKGATLVETCGIFVFPTACILTGPKGAEELGSDPASTRVAPVVFFGPLCVSEERTVDDRHD